MNEQIIRAEELARYPAIDEAKVDALLRKEIEADQAKIVVLDDDPTGVQTVHDISVYTEWTKESIRQGFLETNKLFYILTNSRGFTVAQTTQAHQEIARNVAEVAKELGIHYMIMSRSDSTLRGHYPLETKLLKEGMEANGAPALDGEILCPFFKEGGRFTLNNVHYVKYGNELVPAGQTEFAKDKTFGYTSSDLREYVEEKTGGEYPADDVIYIDLRSLRCMDLDGITDQLMAVKDFNKINDLVTVDTDADLSQLVVEERTIQVWQDLDTRIILTHSMAFEGQKLPLYLNMHGGGFIQGTADWCLTIRRWTCVIPPCWRICRMRSLEAA